MIYERINMRTLFLVFLLGFLLAGAYTLSEAGNKGMIEKNVQELDELNKLAIQQIPDIPEDGQIDIKANVTYRQGSPVFDIYDKKISTEKEGVINLNSNQQTTPSKKGETIENESQNE